MDKIEWFQNSKIQHGNYNDRVYGISIHPDDTPEIIDYIEKLADKHDYGKLFLKIEDPLRNVFETHGFRVEASIPGYFNGKTDGLFMVKYRHDTRMNDHRIKHVNKVLKTAQNKDPLSDPPSLDNRFTFRIAEPSDVSEMTGLYRIVFKTYPFPIHDPDYLIETMKSHILYCGIWDPESLVALSSSEMDLKNSAVEMTDFATRPDYRGHGLATYLLYRMENEMRKKSMKTAYTIARAMSFGMNITFAKHGYRFGGTLINNTNILDTIESMNIWYKPLD